MITDTGMRDGRCKNIGQVLSTNHCQLTLTLAIHSIFTSFSYVLLRLKPRLAVPSSAPPEMYEVLSRQNIHSLVVVPLYDDEKVIGFYGVDNPPAKYIDFASEILQIMGHFIVSSIRRRNLVRRLEIMSYTDPLTGFGNRYAMEKYVSGILPQTKIGVVYCDVTGLKRVNDEEGHSKGDQWILRACDCLRGTLKEFDLFRIGGDEFVALCRGMEEGELYREVEELRTELDREHVTMAVGAAVNTLGAVGFDHLLTEPERRMYQDKAEYYRKSGLNRRRQ